MSACVALTSAIAARCASSRLAYRIPRKQMDRSLSILLITDYTERLLLGLTTGPLTDRE